MSPWSRNCRAGWEDLCHETVTRDEGGRFPTVSLSGPAFFHRGCQAGHECLSVSLALLPVLGTNKIKKLEFTLSITFHLISALKRKKQKALQYEHCPSVWWQRLKWR